MSAEALAARLVAAHRNAAPSEWAPHLAPAGVEEAYRVQEAVLRELDGDRRPAAWKVSPPRPGAAPLASPVPAAGVRASGTRIVERTGVLLGIEAEIAFRIADDGGTGGLPAAEAFVLIELCETRFSNWDAADPFSRLADFQSHGAFITGSGTRDWRDHDFRAQAVELRVGGRVMQRAVGSHPTGDLGVMLGWAVGHCAQRGRPLAAGDIVTMGSWTGITPIRAGEEALASFPGIGEARFTLGA